MAGAGFKTFNTGDVLTSSDVNTYLMQQTVMVFDDATARSTALPTPSEGMFSYLKDTNLTYRYDGSAWLSDAGTTSPLTTKGDVWGYGTTDARIPVGANGTVLTADSAEALGVKWAAPEAGGYTELTSGTLSGSAVNLTNISGSYRSLRLIIRNFLPATDGARCDIRVNADGNQRYYPNTNNDETNGTFAGNDRWFWKNQDNGTTQSIMVIDFPDYANTTTWKFIQGFGAFNNETTTTNVNFKQLNGGYNQTAAITQINIITSTGNFTSGDYVLYGVK